MLPGPEEGQEGHGGGRHPAPQDQGGFHPLQGGHLLGHGQLVRVVSVSGIPKLAPLVGPSFEEEGGALGDG